MAEFPKHSMDEWRARADKELRDRTTDDLVWRTPEGIDIRAVYTADDLDEISWADSLPGFAPFVGGPKATMYAVRPWTIRQYAGFSTAEESNAFYRKASLAVRRGCPLPSIWRPIAATTATTRAWPAMLARRASPSTAWTT